MIVENEAKRLYSRRGIGIALRKTVVLMLVFSLIFTTIVRAEGTNTYDRNRMLGASAIDWQSSNLREWLNSDKDTVDYTGIKPSYSKESGFLSNNNFTQAERDAVAVTKHSAGWQVSLDGNINKTLYISQRTLAHNDFIYNDKVFILHYTDLVNYIEKNKMLMDSNSKYYSNYLQNTTNKRDKYSFVVNSGYYNSQYYGVSALYTSHILETAGRSQQNIVPALSLVPEYVLSNGVKAKNLTLGSKVTFGRYNGEPIEWQVINISNEGYPLLWATRIITTKEYDAPGDINPTKSNHINFSSHDVDISSGNGQAKSWETRTPMDSSTSITILNESDLITPTNNTTIPLQIRVVDSKYPIRKITLPDGRIVNGDYAEWTVTANGEYDIIAENAQGVVTVRHIITKAINTPAEVIIQTDTDKNTKWANRPVNVSIYATNNGVYTKTIPGNKNMGYLGSSTSPFPSWMSLGGKRMRITGTLRNVMTDEEASTVNMNAYIRIRANMKAYNVNQVIKTFPIIKQITLSELKSRGEIPIDMIYTIPSNAYNELYLSVSLNDSTTEFMKPPYNYWMSDFNFEILEKDDLKIEQIILPDGNVVNGDRVTYTIFKNGSYTFLVKDSRGKITSKTIQVAIDTVTPNINIENTQNGYTKLTTLQINSTDDLSGIRSIKLPNGEKRYTNAEGQSLSLSYNITDNGTYTFEVEDYAGNKYSKSINVANIDNKAPNISLSHSPTGWTNNDVVINALGEDLESGIKEIKLPDGRVVPGGSAQYIAKSNGTYTFQAIDNIGNISTKSITISNIDRTPPLLNIVKDAGWSNVGSSVRVEASDNESGFSHIILPNGNRINSNSAVFSTNEVGVYYFTVVDNVGNSTIGYVIIDNIDKAIPKVSIENNQNWTNNQSVSVTIKGEDR